MAITYYASFADFTAQYSLRGSTDEEVNSDYLYYGWNMVNINLGACFTLPFSSNNATAKLLNVMYGYYKYALKTQNQDDSGEIKDNLDEIIENLCTNNAPMVLTDGTALFAQGNQLNQVWSNTEDYKTVFDMREPVDQRIDPDKIQAEWDEDI